MNSIDSQKNANQQAAIQPSEFAQEDDGIDDVVIHVFDDDERIHVYKSDIFAEREDEDEDEDEEVPPLIVTASSGLTVDFLASVILSLPPENADEAEANLNLTGLKKIDLGTPKNKMPTKANLPYKKQDDLVKKDLMNAAAQAGRKKLYYRYAQDPLLNVWYFLETPVFKGLFGNPDSYKFWPHWKGSKRKYLEKRLRVKYGDLGYNKFSVIPDIKSNIEVFKDVELPQTKAGLGMLPKSDILDDFVFEMYLPFYNKLYGVGDFKIREYETHVENIFTDRVRLAELKKLEKKGKKLSQEQVDEINELNIQIEQNENLRLAQKQSILDDYNKKLEEDPDFENRNIRNDPELEKIRRINIKSIVEGLELDFIEKYSKEVNQGVVTIPITQGISKSKLKKGRFKAKVALGTNGSEVTFRINDWSQFSSPDRNMLTSDALIEASTDIGESLRLGIPPYVHCKSGISRSASSLTGGRVKLFIDDRLANGIRPSAKDIKDLISEQIDILAKFRPEVKIRGGQRANLERVFLKYTANQELGRP